MAQRFTYPAWHYLPVLVFTSLLFISWTEPVCHSSIIPNSSTENSILMPVFETPPPDDITVDCFDDVPSPVDLMANDGMGGMPFAVSPVDAPIGPIDACMGGIITRTWTATVGMESTSVSQIITVSPDNTGPVVMVDVTPDTVACELAQLTAPNNAFRFDTWQSSLSVAVSTNAMDCAGVNSITETNMPIYPGDCGSTTYSFELEDVCGNMSEVTFTYVTIDTVKPEFIGLPLSDTLDCSAMIPAAPMVTVLDNCTPDMVATFVETSTQVIDGTCAEYEYIITRTWSALDSCGNFNSYEQILRIIDETPPSYSAPPNTTISCTSDPLDLNITGNVTNVQDNCSPTVNITFTDSTSPGTCPDEMIIIRTWRAIDICNNVAGKIQEITVSDMQGPSFNVPVDITVDCNGVDQLSITGEPTNLIDDCDPAPMMTSSDLIVPGPCPNTYIIERVWRADDRCDNFTEKVQIITVADVEKPTFTQAPQSVAYNCLQAFDVNQAFAIWVDERGGAMATDNCTDDDDLTWIIYNSGTNDPPSLPNITCPAVNGAILSRLLDVIVEDECGNRDTMNMLFELLDQTPPSLSNCPADFTAPTDPGLCEGSVTLYPPLMSDECGINTLVESISDAIILTSGATPGEEGDIPVNPVHFQLNVIQPLPITAAGIGTLTIELLSADAESAEEYFLVYTENGSLLGQTNYTDVQCGDSETIFMVPADSINLWSIDGIIEVFLEPNIPADLEGKFAINANCNPPSFATANFEFLIQELEQFSYQYSIDDGNRVDVDPVQAVDVTLDQGSHLIRYFATDCAGNSDSCSYTIMITDQEPPTLACPADIADEVAADSCIKTITLPLPSSLVDNCMAYGGYNRVLPATAGEALITFTEDPNLNEFLAETKTLVFDDVAANAYTDVTLIIDMQGDFNSNDAFIRVFGDDGSTLIVSAVGIADCATAGQVSTTISAAVFNTWAADGVVNITLDPNDISVPPGVAGDGIGPCNPGMVNNNGDNDGVSFMTATLSYENLSAQFYTEGATETPVTAFEAPNFEPQLSFNIGTTDVFFISSDQGGNIDTCAFEVDIADNIMPTALCQPANLFINPSGLQVEVVDASDVDNGSFDNCMIDSMWLTPNFFTCADIGQTVNVILSVQDETGNIGTCNTVVGIAPERPMPTANSGLCGGDTLYLIANPPLPEGNVYTFEWFDPMDNLISTDEDVVIPNIDADAEGAYKVVVTGLTGCTSEGVVFVSIEDLPLTPEIEAPLSICASENLLLETSLVPSGNDVQFYWYEGIPPMGTLIDSSFMPFYEISAPHTLGSHSYYMTVTANGCLSPFSAAVEVMVYERPTAIVAFSDTIVCGSETIFLGASSQSDAEYHWTGPNTFDSNDQFAEAGPLNDVDGGYYFLTVNRGECVSLPDSTLITIKPQPEQPSISSNSPICEGEVLTLITTTTNASAYHWEGPNGNVVTTTVPTYTVDPVELAQQGNWTVYVTRNGCDSPESTPTNVVVNLANTASAAALPNPACEGDDVVLQSFATVSGSTYNWEGANNYTSEVQMPTLETVSSADAGIYSVTVTSPFGCTDSTSLDLEIFNGVTIVGLSDNVPACINEGFQLVVVGSTFPADNGSYIYEWYTEGNPAPIANTPGILLIPNVTPADAGNYSLEVITADGCHSDRETHTVGLNFIPDQPDLPFTISGETSFCEGESFTLVTTSYNSSDITYYWNTPQGIIMTDNNSLVVEDITSFDDGDYSVYVIENGCESTTSPPRNITVNFIPEVSIESNSPVCESDLITLQATFYPQGMYNWSGPSSFTSSIFNPVRPNADSALHAGTYTVFVSRFGCVSDTVSAQVQVKPRPTAPDINFNAPICLDNIDAVLVLGIDTITAVENATYTWVSGDGTDFVGGPTSELIYEFIDFDDYPGGDSYNFYAQANLDGCTSLLSDPVSVQFDTIPSNQAFAGIDTTVCSGTYELQGATPAIGTGNWQLISPESPADFSIINPSEAQSTVNGLTVAEAPYILEWVLSNGACYQFSRDTLALGVISAEPAQANGDILACLDEEIVLSAMPTGAGSMGVWQQGNTQVIFGVNILDSLNATTEITGLLSNNVYFFDWVVTSVCGVTSDQVIVNVSDPEPNAGSDIIVCDDVPDGQLAAETPAIGSVGEWHSLNPVVTITEPLNINSTVSNLQVGENLFIWEIDEGFCGPSSRDTVSIFYKVPAVLTDDEVSVPFGMAVEAMPFVNDQIPANTNLEISNQPALGTADVGIGNNILTYTPPNNFVGTDELVYFAVSEGCPEASALITFIIGAGANCTPPSIITPNNDGINDNFVVPCLLDKGLFPNSQVVIFNRWGDEVFRSPIPYDSNWGGTYDGEDLPADTYFYIVEFGDNSDPVAGYVLIQR